MSRVEKALVATLIITVAWFSLSFLRGWECESVRNARAKIMCLYQTAQDATQANLRR